MQDAFVIQTKISRTTRAERERLEIKRQDY